MGGKNEGFPVDVLTNSPLIMSRKPHPYNILVVDPLVGIDRPLNIRCIFHSHKKKVRTILSIIQDKIDFSTHPSL